MTLIGTPPNLVIQNTLTDAGYPSLSFFSFLPVGLICVVVGTIVLLPLSKIFLSKRGAESRTGKHSGKSLKELVHEYGLSDNLFRLRIPAKSVLKGKTIVDLDIRRRYGLNILEVRRGEASQHRFLKTITQKLAEPNTHPASRRYSICQRRFRTSKRLGRSTPTGNSRRPGLGRHTQRPFAGFL